MDKYESAALALAQAEAQRDELACAMRELLAGIVDDARVPGILALRIKAGRAALRKLEEE